MRLGFAMIAALSTAMLGLAACASKPSQLDGATPVEIAFARAAPTWDLDHDGTVTCEEWQTYASRLFAEADQGGKGYLTAEDFRALARTDHLFDSANFEYFGGTPSKGVTQAQFVGKPNPAFRLLDRDKDCRLVQEELHPRLAPRPEERRDEASARRRPH